MLPEMHSTYKKVKIRMKIILKLCVLVIVTFQLSFGVDTTSEGAPFRVRDLGNGHKVELYATPDELIKNNPNPKEGFGYVVDHQAPSTKHQAPR